MKKQKFTSLLFTFLLLLISISSCKKEGVSSDNESTHLSTVDTVKSVSVSRDGIAIITTISGNRYTQDLSVKASQKPLTTTSTASNQDSTLTFTLTPPVSRPKTGPPGTNLVDPNSPGGFAPITATVEYSGGFTTITLSSYSQFSNGVTQTATVYGISGNSYGGGILRTICANFRWSSNQFTIN